MELKELIKLRREELGLTLEELGKLVGVGKSTIRKWETGMIENMRRDNIVALSKALDLSPAILMGWDEIDAPTSISFTKDNISPKERKLLDSFSLLNDQGKKEAIKRVSELTFFDIYKQKNALVQIETIAAHNDHLDKDGEVEKIMEDIEDMKNWEK